MLLTSYIERSYVIFHETVYTDGVNFLVRMVKRLLLIFQSGTSAVSQTRGNRSALGLKMERENSAFIDPPIEQKAESEVWEKAANMWLYKNQPVWGNIARH